MLNVVVYSLAGFGGAVLAALLVRCIVRAVRDIYQVFCDIEEISKYEE